MNTDAIRSLVGVVDYVDTAIGEVDNDLAHEVLAVIHDTLASLISAIAKEAI